MLWREYAHMEWILGNLDEARKVFSTTTAMGGTEGLSSPSFCELCLLWAQLEVEVGASVQAGGLTDVTASPAVSVLAKLAEENSSFCSSSSQSLSPVSILKARRAYEQALTDGLSALDRDSNKSQTTKKGLVFQLPQQHQFNKAHIIHYWSVLLLSTPLTSYLFPENNIKALFHGFPVKSCLF